MPRPHIRAILIDLSGTLHIGNNPTPSAADALRRVRDAGITVRFCSNTSKESTTALRSTLNSMGIQVNEGELWTSLGALKDIVKLKKLQKPFFLLSESAMEEFPEFRGKSSEDHHSEYDSVIIGYSPSHFNYGTINKAFRILTTSSDASEVDQTRPPLIATHRAKYLRTSDGELSIGPGPFIAALEDAVGSGLHGEIVGKPNREFFERVLTSIPNLESSNTEGTAKDYRNVALVGDDIEADLGGGAVELGLWRVLVKTGKYRLGDENREGHHPPDELQYSLSTFVDDLLKERHEHPLSSVESIE